MQEAMSGVLIKMLIVCGVLIVFLILGIIKHFSKDRAVKDNIGKLQIVFLIIVSIVVAVVLYNNYKGGYYDNEPKQQKIQLEAQITLDYDVLTITNKNSFTWRSIETMKGSGIILYINEYKFLYKRDITPGKTFSVGVEVFRDAMGNLLKRSRTTPTTLKIECKDGERTFYL